MPNDGFFVSPVKKRIRMNVHGYFIDGTTEVVGEKKRRKHIRDKIGMKFLQFGLFENFIYTNRFLEELFLGMDRK